MAKKQKANHSIKRRVLGILLVTISLYYLYSLLFPGKSFTFVYNIIKYINQFIGLGKYAIFVFIIVEGLSLLFNVRFPNIYNKIFGITALLLIFLAFIHLKLIFSEHAYILAVHGAGGGLYGYYMANFLYNYFGLSGSYLFLIALGLIAILFATDVSFLYILNFVFKKVYSIFSNII